MGYTTDSCPMRTKTLILPKKKGKVRRLGVKSDDLGLSPTTWGYIVQPRIVRVYPFFFGSINVFLYA